MTKKSTILIIPDTQAPFEHRDTLRFLRAVKARFKPNHVVHIGDEVDFHALGDWDHDPDGLSAGDELKKALVFMKDLYKLFPEVKACTSNHTSRPFRRAFKHGIPRAFLKDYHEFLQAPKGWKWADKWEIDGIIFEHGEGQSGKDGAINAAKGNMQSTVIGHIHAFAGIQYAANPKFLYFGFNVGCLIDRHAYAFAYGKNMKNKPILGCGIIVNGIPQFIPMELNKKGYWNGKL